MQNVWESWARVLALPNKDQSKISVLDVDNRHISFTHPAKARILVKQGKALVFNTNPFTIRLKGEKRVRKMDMLQAVKNFTNYFKEERDVYVLNMSNTQIALQFGKAPDIYPIIIPESQKPYNLTQFVPFEELKKSMDLRKMLNRHPPIMDLLNEDEYNNFYEKLASDKGTTVDVEILEAYEEQRLLLSRSKQVDSGRKLSKDVDKDAEKEVVEVQEMIYPPITGLCMRQGEDAGSDMLPEDEFVRKLEGMAHNLKRVDYEYLQSHLIYQKAKDWVLKQLAHVQV